MSYAQYFAVDEYDWTQWVVFGGHAVVAFLFLAAAVNTVGSGGELLGAGLQATLALLVLGLGLTVAKMMGNRS
jgi:hypothetical protein